MVVVRMWRRRTPRNAEQVNMWVKWLPKSEAATRHFQGLFHPCTSWEAQAGSPPKLFPCANADHHVLYLFPYMQIARGKGG